MARPTIQELIRTEGFWFSSQSYELSAMLLSLSLDPSPQRIIAIFIALIALDRSNQLYLNGQHSFAPAFALRLVGILPLVFATAIEIPDQIFYVPIILLVTQLLLTQLARMNWWALVPLIPVCTGSFLFYVEKLQEVGGQDAIRQGSNLMLFAGLGFFITYMFFLSNREAEARLLSVRSLNDFMNFRIQIVMHDLLNRVHGLSACYHEQELSKVLDRLERFQQEANQLIRSLRNEKREWVNVRDLCEEFEREHGDFKLSVRIHGDYHEIKVNRRSIKDILQNLIENAVEAGLSKGINPVLRIEWAFPTLMVSDNCGGFPLHAIKSNKGSEHGVFLKRIFLNPEITQMLGFKSEIQQIRRGDQAFGTRMLLHFQTNSIRTRRSDTKDLQLKRSL
jgi:signal transduction histidine kinase